MPAPEVVNVKKREGRSEVRVRCRMVTCQEPVYIHRMMTRRGDDEDGHAIVQTAVQNQIVKKLVDLNGTFGGLHEQRSGEVVRPADGSMQGEATRGGAPKYVGRTTGGWAGKNLKYFWETKLLPHLNGLEKFKIISGVWGGAPSGVWGGSPSGRPRRVDFFEIGGAETRYFHRKRPF